MKTKFDINNIIRPTVKNMKPYSSARDEFEGDPNETIFLDANENPFESGVNRYPDPQQCDLKSILSEIKGLPVKNILLGNGSDEVLDLIFRAFCEPKKDNIIYLPPTYGMYQVLANLNDIEIKTVKLTDDFQPKVKAILNASNKASKILFLCSPNNPTGNSFKASDIEKLLIAFNGLVVIDEAYIDFSDEKSWIERLEEFPNLIVTQTLSKAYGMAGIRLGICYASAEIIKVLNNIKAPYNVNKLTQQKAIEQLSIKDLAKNQIEDILRERKQLVLELNTINFVSKIYPTDANFVLVKVDDATKRYNQLIDNGVVVRNRTNESGCENCLRLTVGTADENKKLLKELSIISKS